MRVLGYAYPWDVAEPGFVDRVADLGVDEVAVATAYHSTRAATPWSTTHSTAYAPQAALYRPVRESAWRDRPLRPAGPDWLADRLDDPDPAGSAVRALRAAGVPTAAWVVLTHSSRLGEQRPDLTVRSCFGEPYPWALCPSRPEVREYAATLAAESVRDLDVDTVVLEACGQLGAVHQCRHEKTDAVWSPAVARLLSVCCCRACAPEEGVVEALRDEVVRLVGKGDLDATGTDLPGDLLDAQLATRHAATDALRRAVLDALPDHAPVALHGSADPWATGALPGLTADAGGEVDRVVLPCWQPGEDTLAAVREARRRVPASTPLGGYVTATGPIPLADPAAYVRALGTAGVTELHLYHLGLAGPARWPDLRAATMAAHAG